MQVPIALVAILSVGFGLKLPRSSTGDFRANIARVDFAGAGTLVFATFFLLYGIDRGGNVSWNDHITIATLSASAVLYALFVLVEIEWAREPFAPRRIVTNRSLLASYLANLFGCGAGITVLFTISLYLQAVQGASASQVGLILLPTIVASVAGSLLAGLVMQTTGKYYVLTLAVFILVLVGSVVVALVTGVVQYSLAALIFGMTINLIILLAVPSISRYLYPRCCYTQPRRR